MKRSLALLLALLMLALPACAADPAPAENDTTAVTDTAEEISETTEPAIPYDKLPSDLDYKGATFRVFTRLKYFYHGEMFIMESNGEMLNDARFDAKTKVEERLKISFKEDYYGIIDYSDNDAPRNLLLSGDATYDIYNGRHVNMFNYAAEGLAQKLTDIPHVDLTALWWDEEFSSEVTLGKEKYFALGAYNLTTYDSIHMLLFSKDMYEDLGVEEKRLGGKSIYDVVREGKWTMDLFKSTITDVSADLNGDSKMTEVDRYAYVTPAKHILPSFLLGMDQYMLKKDENNFLYNNMEGNETFFNMYTAILDMVWNNSMWHPTVASMTDETEQMEYGMFKSGLSMYTDSTGGNVSSFRDMEGDFGIIPYPKLNEDQENYRSRSEYPELFVIPLVNTRQAMTGAVLEALSSEYYRSVRPVYFELSMEGRDTRDVESVEMLDIIYSNRVFDFGDTIFCSEIRDGKLRYMLVDKNYDLTSALVSIAPKVNQKMDTLNQGFGKK